MPQQQTEGRREKQLFNIADSIDDAGPPQGLLRSALFDRCNRRDGAPDGTGGSDAARRHRVKHVFERVTMADRALAEYSTNGPESLGLRICSLIGPIRAACRRWHRRAGMAVIGSEKCTVTAAENWPSPLETSP